MGREQMGREPVRDLEQAVGDPPDVAVPLALDVPLSTGPPEQPRASQPTYWWLQVIGRLKPGVTPTQASAETNLLFKQILRCW